MTTDLAASPTPYQLLPRLTDDEYGALKADIAANGIRVPIDVDEAGTIIDGHHRSWIAADLGVDCPRRVVAGLSDEQKRDHALAVNVHRRNLTRDQRRELIKRLRGDGMSERRIAEVTQFPKTTVHDAIANDVVESDHVVPPITGNDGKTYSPQTLEQRRDLAAKLRAEGMSFQEIADAMGVAKTTAQSLLAPRKSTAPASTPVVRAPDDAARLKRIREMASAGHSSQQIAREVGNTDDYVRRLAKANDIDIPADKAIGKQRRIDSNVVMQELVATLESLALPIRLINLDDLDAARTDEWANSLTDSIRALNRFAKQIKELLTQ